MKRDDALVKSVERLCDLEVEYDLTVRVLAVLTELLQRSTRSLEIRISDDALDAQPDLTAWRNDDGTISLRATR